MSTLQEKLARLGESLGRARIERELRLRIIRRSDDEGSYSYQLQHLNADGSARAVQPTAEGAFRLQTCLLGLANELAENVSELAGAYAAERSKVERQADLIIEMERRLEEGIAHARNDGYEDGFNAARVAFGAAISEVEPRRGILAVGSPSATLSALTEKLANLNPHANVT